MRFMSDATELYSAAFSTIKETIVYPIIIFIEKKNPKQHTLFGTKGFLGSHPTEFHYHILLYSYQIYINRKFIVDSFVS